MLRRSFSCALLVCAVACAVLEACSRAPTPQVAPDAIPVAQQVTNVRIAPGETPVAPGDCAEAMRRALAKPDLAVDRIPSPLVAKPPALQRPPRTALRKDGSADIKVDVLIDTLGRADMTTFTVVTASHPWLVNNVKRVIPHWTFEPAELAGCKVPRVYHFMASAPPKSAR